jgi:hypothetical protein
MKKRISILLLSTSFITSFILVYIANAQVAIGSRSEDVKVIQEILKTDPEIYPEGYVTGYYGPLTTAAVKRVQARCGIPETGIIDSETERCIYPIGFKVRVLYPNGGEVLDRNQIHTVRWEVITPVGIPEILPNPFWAKVSIDLFRRVITDPCPTDSTEPRCLAPTTQRSIFVKHIATVNLLDRAYSGKIPSDIPNGKDYIIRISVGEPIGDIWYLDRQGTSISPGEITWPDSLISPAFTWDESDGTFEITGQIQPEPLPLGEVIKILEGIVLELQRAITLLREMIR